METDFFYFSNHVRIWIERQHQLYNQRNSALIFPLVFGICCRCHNLTYFNKVCLTRKPLIEIVDFTKQSLVFHSRLLNDAHSISDITLLWINIDYFYFDWIKCWKTFPPENWNISWCTLFRAEVPLVKVVMCCEGWFAVIFIPSVVFLRFDKHYCKLPTWDYNEFLYLWINCS